MREQLEKAQQTAELLEDDLYELVQKVEMLGNRPNASTIHKWITYVQEMRKDLAELG